MAIITDQRHQRLDARIAGLVEALHAETDRRKAAEALAENLTSDVLIYKQILDGALEHGHQQHVEIVKLQTTYSRLRNELRDLRGQDRRAA